MLDETKQEYWYKVNTILQCGGWFLSNTESSLSQMLCQLHMGEMKIIESHFVYSLDYTIKFLPSFSSIILTS